MKRKKAKVLLGAMILLPVIFIALLALALFIFPSDAEQTDTKEDNEKLAQEAKNAGYNAIAFSCKKLQETVTVDGVRYVQFMEGGRITEDHPAIAFREDASYKIAYELRQGYKYDFYGTEAGKLSEKVMLVEPYCLVRDTHMDGIGRVLGDLGVIGKAFVGLIILAVAELSFYVSARKSTVISDD